MKFITALSDIGQPFSCEQWGVAGTIGSPLIVEDDGTLNHWFKDSNGQFPNYVIIDHTMTVRAKPSNLLNNSNTDSCDSDNIDEWEGGCINTFISQLLNECGDGCNSSNMCNDGSACNIGANADCIYPADNYDCCGECNVGYDCAGICGGQTEESDPACDQQTNVCPTCIIVSPDSEAYNTIQSGIDAAEPGDTVLVERGVYYENLIINKDITLASRAIFDDLSNWLGYIDQYEILNNNIKETIIDGSHSTNGSSLESAILIYSPESVCISCKIFGFTIKGGKGTTFIEDIDYVTTEGGEDLELITTNKYGAGFLAYYSNPLINYNYFTNNENILISYENENKFASTEGTRGGGGEINMSGSGIDFGERFGIYNGERDCGNIVDLSNNFYRGNSADKGNTFSTMMFEGDIDMTGCVFDIYNCSDEDVSSSWVEVEDDVEIDFSNGVGDQCTVSGEIWISPFGDDNNTGTSVSDPFRTLKKAIESIAPTEDNPVNIYITEGEVDIGATCNIEIPLHTYISGQGEGMSYLTHLNYICDKYDILFFEAGDENASNQMNNVSFIIDYYLDNLHSGNNFRGIDVSFDPTTTIFYPNLDSLSLDHFGFIGFPSKLAYYKDGYGWLGNSIHSIDHTEPWWIKNPNDINYLSLKIKYDNINIYLQSVSPITPDTEWCLEYGVNGVTFASLGDYEAGFDSVIPDNVPVIAILSEGVACANTGYGWIGSGCFISPGFGYLFHMEESVCFQFDFSESRNVR